MKIRASISSETGVRQISPVNSRVVFFASMPAVPSNTLIARVSVTATQSTNLYFERVHNLRLYEVETDDVFIDIQEFVALVSGGKDSCFNIMKCVQDGHELVCLANLSPPAGKDELDSYMYQTVGHNAVALFDEVFGLPLVRRIIQGKSINTKLDYTVEANDEVEDLFKLLSEVLKKYPDVQGVSVGAIRSEYQMSRVKNVCQRLNLKPLCYLWNVDQFILLREIISSGIKAVLVKCASYGLAAEHLGKDLAEVKDILYSLHDKHGTSVCGEGGEYETLVLDCPLFKRKIVIDDVQSVTDSTACSFYILRKFHLEKKSL